MGVKWGVKQTCFVTCVCVRVSLQEQPQRRPGEQGGVQWLWVQHPRLVSLACLPPSLPPAFLVSWWWLIIKCKIRSVETVLNTYMHVRAHMHTRTHTRTHTHTHTHTHTGTCTHTKLNLRNLKMAATANRDMRWMKTAEEGVSVLEDGEGGSALGWGQVC